MAERPLTPEEYHAAEGISDEIDEAKKHELFLDFEKELENLDTTAHEKLPLVHSGEFGAEHAGKIPGEVLATHEHIETDDERLVKLVEEKNRLFSEANKIMDHNTDARKVWADLFREKVVGAYAHFRGSEDRGDKIFLMGQVNDALREFLRRYRLGKE